ncbi:PREDICTED: outer envelope membrane protein 7-like [Camelina sativa]|uniref:Outer envelope membrane protein 7-like n=1 Tax=Camelina sativa TaxID=90675 RepID=A0ABM1R3S5_CAMSA|nr:PREDICTED: outer envelope membrane protein 7-like [Camelina sativa]XP_019093664.1 PREDICTED: outer envelope membrane protein 7-like [Camelina sativa]
MGDKSVEAHFPKLEKPTGKKQTATVVVGVLAVGWLAIELVFKPLFKKLSSPKDKPDSDNTTVPPPPSDAL